MNWRTLLSRIALLVGTLGVLTSLALTGFYLYLVHTYECSSTENLPNIFCLGPPDYIDFAPILIASPFVGAILFVFGFFYLRQRTPTKKEWFVMGAILFILVIANMWALSVSPTAVPITDQIGNS